MTTPFIPSRDGLALTWMQTFAQGITASPATYQLTAADAAAITGAVDAYGAAYGEATDPATRTSVTIATKDETRNSAIAICRQYALQIKFNAGVSNSAKISIGVRPVHNSRSPIEAPSSSPLLNVIGATPGSQTVRYADTNTPDSAKKPFGATQLQLFVVVAAAASTDADAATFYGAFTRNPIGVGFDPADDGKVATYFARWQSRRGDVGPWSLPVSMRIAA